MELRKILIEYCYHFIQGKLENINEAISITQESANNETKSSAGDKHETSRAMAQLEKEKLLKQKEQILHMKITMDYIKNFSPKNTSALGSLVSTTQGDFFLAIPIGITVIDTKDITILSPSAPVGKLLMNKQKGDSFEFNGVVYEVTSVQ